MKQFTSLSAILLIVVRMGLVRNAPNIWIHCYCIFFIQSVKKKMIEIGLIIVIEKYRDWDFVAGNQILALIQTLKLQGKFSCVWQDLNKILSVSSFDCWCTADVIAYVTSKVLGSHEISGKWDSHRRWKILSTFQESHNMNNTGFQLTVNEMKWNRFHFNHTRLIFFWSSAFVACLVAKHRPSWSTESLSFRYSCHIPS